MGGSQERTGYLVEIEPQAKEDLVSLDSTVIKRIAEKIDWLGENAFLVKHSRLLHLPADLKGLCKYKIGDYRILYWVYHHSRVIKIYGIEHRSKKYREIRGKG